MCRVTGTGDTEKYLVQVATLQPLHEFRDSLRLIAARQVVCRQFEFFHRGIVPRRDRF